VVVGDDVEEESFFDEEIGPDGPDDFFVKLDIDFVFCCVGNFFDFEFFDECFAVDVEGVSRAEFFVDFDRAADEAA